MRRILGSLIVVLVAGSATALAGPIAISGSTSDPRYIASTSDNSNLGSESDICTAFGLGTNCLGGSSLIYKANTDGSSSSGSASGSYSTTFSPSTDPSGATISYVSGVAANCPSCYLLVKDGSASPAQFLFSLNAITGDPAWDGTSTITLSGFWDGIPGAISNVAIWGNVTPDDPGDPSPDGGATLSLLGGALVGLGVLRRKYRR